jgi:hypothetical protein
MAVSFVEIEDRYKPKTTDQTIFASVLIGDAGVGGYVIFLDMVLKGINKRASLGKASKVLGKRTTLSVTVPDVLEETNWTSITVLIEEGNSKTTYGPYRKEVVQHLDTVCFVVKILNTDEF